jgi:hypothetical protein
MAFNWSQLPIPKEGDWQAVRQAFQVIRTWGMKLGNLFGPASSTNGALAAWDGTDGTKLKVGPTVTTTVGSPGADTKIPTEKAVRDALGSATADLFIDFGSPVSANTFVMTVDAGAP